LEDRLHALVVNGKLDLKTAQREIATDWIAAYKKYIGPSPDSGHHLRTVWIAHVKDRLEDRLHALVAASWTLKPHSARSRPTGSRPTKKYVGPSPDSGHYRLDQAGAGLNGSAPAPYLRGEAAVSTEASRGKVWVNTSSGKYFRHGQQWYGKTKRGEYMSEAEAIRRG
jgi:hypothetical protein